MAALSILVLFCLLHQSFCINTFQFIKKYKDLVNSTVTVLKDSNNKTILQYEYIIANYKEVTTVLNGTTLVVGFLEDTDSVFDCHYKNNNLLEGYSFDVLKELQKLFKFE